METDHHDNADIALEDALHNLLGELQLGGGGEASEDETDPIEFDDDLEPNPDEQPAIRLKTGIDRAQLMNADSEGVDFEVIPEGIQNETDTSIGRSNPQYFGDEEYKMGNNIALGECDGTVEDEYSGLPPFQLHIKKCNLVDITPNKNGKVWKRVVQEGTGPVVSDSSLVRVHYSAWCELADEPFDCTRLQERPRSLKLGTGECILGLDLGISTMRLNERAEFVIYPEYAYGKLGCPPRVPQNALILFQVTLIQCIEHAGVDEYFKMGKKLQQEVPFDQFMRIMRAEREVGNDMYRRKHYIGALRRYRRAVQALEVRHLSDDQEEEKQQKAMLKFYLNIAQCYIAQSKWPKVITYSSHALHIDAKNGKALYKMGKALRKLQEYKRARYFLRRGLKQSPNNSDIARELKELDQDIKRYTESEKEFCQRMFSSSAVNQRVNEAENIPPEEESEVIDPLVTCSQSFKDCVNKQLATFIAEKDCNEIPFPASRFNKSELAYIGTIAKRMNLVVLYRGEGGDLQIVIRKN